jgi:dynein light intermediate chain, axonemal
VSTGPRKGKDGKGLYDNKEVGVTKTEDILNSILPPREYTKDK